MALMPVPLNDLADGCTTDAGDDRFFSELRSGGWEKATTILLSRQQQHTGGP